MSREHPAVPLDSATVILIREAGANTCEVLLVERHAESRAFAGAHVFPGGRVDAVANGSTKPNVRYGELCQPAGANTQLESPISATWGAA